MSAFPEYERYDGLGLAELVRRGEVTPGDLLDSAIERVERSNPAINAVVDRLYGRARAAVAAGPPQGVRPENLEATVIAKVAVNPQPSARGPVPDAKAG